MNSKSAVVVFMLLSALMMGACAPSTPAEATPDVSVIRTSAASTVVAELTQTAVMLPPTSLPTTPPTETASPEPATATATMAYATDPTQIALGTPGLLCDDMSFDNATVDVTILDGTEMVAGKDFVKTWKIKNTGACAWGEGYGLAYAGYADRMEGVAAPLGTLIEVGQEIDVSVNFKAPDALGEYVSAWNMVNAKGIPFGKVLFVKIKVK